MKSTLYSLLISVGLIGLSPAANTILFGTDPIEENGGPDGWDGIAVLTTPIAGPPGETLGIISSINFVAAEDRVDPAGLLTPLLVKESGGEFTIAGVGAQIEVLEGGIHEDVPFNLVEGTDTVDLSGNDNFHIAIAQERKDTGNNQAGGIVPFAGSGGKGMFYFDTQPPHEPKVGDVVEAGHESGDDGRLYQFNFAIEFSDDDPNALLPRTVDLGQVPSTEPHPFTIDVRNSGDNNELVVESVEVTGGPQADSFSVVDFSSTVEPRGTGAINLQVDTKGVTGLFQGVIQVRTNDATEDDQVVDIEISASVLNLLGPASRLTLDEPAGATELIDNTGFNRHGTLNAFDGTATLGEPGLSTETGTAMKVSGGGGAGIPGASFEGSLDEFTIAIWANAASLGSLADQSFVTLIGMGEETPFFGLLSADGELLWFGDVNGNADVVFATDTTPISVNTTHHLVMMRSAARASIWVDGVEVAGMDNPPGIDDTQLSTLYFGGFNGALGFDGVIDDVQVYDRAVPGEDIVFLHANPGATLPSDDCIDSDGDRLCNDDEEGLGTDPLNPDTDGDTLADGDEVEIHLTDPLKADTDGDLHDDARELAKGWDPNDAADPGFPPAIRAGDPNEPLVARAAVDGWSSIMVIDEERPFNLGAPSGVLQDFEFWVGAAVGRVTPFIAERTADNAFIVKAIGTTRVVDVDYDIDDEATAVSFPFDDNNNAVEVLDGWVAGFTVADPDGSNNAGAVIPFDGGGGDMWLTGGPAPEESASITVGEAPNTEGTNTVFEDSLARLYAFAITAQAGEGPPQPTDRSELGAVAISEGAQTAAGLVDFGELTGDTTYEFSFNAIKGGPSTAITGNDSWGIKLDQWNEQGVFGTTEFGVADNIFEALDGQSVASVFGEDVHVVLVNDTAAGETRLYINGVQTGVWAGNFELAGEVNLMGARIANPVDAMGDGSVMHGWATYNSALSDDNIAALVNLPFPSGGDPGGRPFVLENVGLNDDGAFTMTIPDGQTANVEYSTDLINWEVIATDASGTVVETDPDRLAAPEGYYRAQ